MFGSVVLLSRRNDRVSWDIVGEHTSKRALVPTVQVQQFALIIPSKREQ